MVNRKALVPYCGGAPGLAPSAAASPGGGAVGVRVAAAAASTFLASDAASSSSSSGGPFAELWALHGPRSPVGPWPEAPRLPIGPLGVPRAPIGRDARPQALPLPLPLPLPPRPDDELDGCEEPERAGAGADVVPSPSPAAAEEPGTEEQDGKQKGGGGGDELRKATLAVVGRYLREAAALQEERFEQGGAGAGGGGAKVLLQGLWERLGSAAGSPLPAPPEPEVGRALETLRRVGGGILEKHQLAFQGMLRKMEIKNENDLKTVSEVAKFVFDDGITNWGRIATLISFGAFVAKHLKSIHQEHCINSLAEIITDVLVTDKRDWLVEHDAWEGFVKFFHVEDIEGSVRSVLMAFAGVAGLGASLAYMIR